MSKITYLIKEAKYYKRLGKGHFKRMFTKFMLAKTPISKVVNTSIYNKIYSNKIKKRVKIIKPKIFQIENTNLCNAKCIMCPHTIMKRKPKTMNQEDFVKICKNVLKYEKINLITITGFGEPLIDKGIINKIKWINDNYPKINIDIYTNASLLTPELSKELLNLDIHKINFSINGTKKSYKKVMSLDYDQTKKNIIYFLNEKKRKKIKYPLTNISLMILKENQEEVEDVINFWKNKTDSIMTYLPSDWAGSLKSTSFVNQNPFKSKRWPCKALWDIIMADVEGNVIMCCRDYESKVIFGNLLKNNIKEIRGGEKFQDLLKRQLKEDYNTPICCSCDNVFDSSLVWWEG